MLKKYTTEQLQTELDQRRNVMPKELNEFDFKLLVMRCKIYIEYARDGEPRGEMANLIFETAMEAIYGNVWGWVNDQDSTQN